MFWIDIKPYEIWDVAETWVVLELWDETVEVTDEDEIFVVAKDDDNAKLEAVDEDKSSNGEDDNNVGFKVLDKDELTNDEDDNNVGLKEDDNGKNVETDEDGIVFEVKSVVDWSVPTVEVRINVWTVEDCVGFVIVDEKTVVGEEMSGVVGIVWIAEIEGNIVKVDDPGKLLENLICVKLGTFVDDCGVVVVILVSVVEIWSVFKIVKIFGEDDKNKDELWTWKVDELSTTEVDDDDVKFVVFVIAIIVVDSENCVFNDSGNVLVSTIENILNGENMTETFVFGVSVVVKTLVEVDTTFDVDWKSRAELDRNSPTVVSSDEINRLKQRLIWIKPRKFT